MELALAICENLPWKAPNGQLRVHGCLELLEQLDADGMVQLPVKRARRPYRPARLQAEALPELQIAAHLGEVRSVTVEPVSPEEQAVWDATVNQHHALGFRRAFGVQERYWIYGQCSDQRVILGAFLFSVSDFVVRTLLHEMGYSLQANRKTLEGAGHPDRDAQFQYINATVQDYQQRSQPVISVDTKKKELVGDFKSAGREWQVKGHPEEVRVHDFVVPELGKVTPYGVYDPARNEGWVNVGTDHDTAAFSVASIRGWWQNMGHSAYPNATELLITADGGGSNSSRSRLWKVELQKLADDIGLQIRVCHFPPGTSKWNKIEHKLFSHIAQNWRGRPLISHEVIVNLIANTTTTKGLKVQCQLDTNTYPTGVQVPDADLAAVQLERSDFHGDWNYVIGTRAQK